MRTLSKLAVYSLLTSALFSACSRPYATYQKMPVERFGSRQEVPAVSTPQTPAEDVAVASVESPAVAPAETATPLTTAAALKNVEQKLQETVARSDNKLAGTKKLEKRMARVQSLLAEASVKATTTAENKTASALTTTHKMNLAERMMMKKIDKKIKNSLAPDEAQAMSRTLRAGIIIAIIGLILSLLGGVLSLIGVLMLIAGLVLILVDVLSQA
ncbi:hypothetical protein [Larkinella rosea]|uniref:Uncharacterized protein n=1 Tax=Larkinella rosea TaxID=2025312 RepID=A0A3P1BML7_9BACT|nr:hypothetical protein [Larkinella rosea]RRB02299.1 hypothetical protein EHT25_17655 [Larkinella rosea]